VIHVDTERGWRGGQRQVLLLARELQSRGVDQILVAPLESRLLDEARRVGIPTSPCGSGPKSTHRRAHAPRHGLCRHSNRRPYTRGPCSRACGASPAPSLGSATPARRVEASRQPTPAIGLLEMEMVRRSRPDPLRVAGGSARGAPSPLGRGGADRRGLQRCGGPAERGSEGRAELEPRGRGRRLAWSASGVWSLTRGTKR
jgi:hypothetical protein